MITIRHAHDRGHSDLGWLDSRHSFSFGHYYDPKRGMGLELAPGMTFTIEPMVNAGGYQVRLLPDGWTVVTKDRALSAQWEHTIAVTDTGFEVLTRRPEEDW